MYLKLGKAGRWNQEGVIMNAYQRETMWIIIVMVLIGSLVSVGFLVADTNNVKTLTDYQSQTLTILAFPSLIAAGFGGLNLGTGWKGGLTIFLLTFLISYGIYRILA